ncbi:MAG: hypothetical protein GXP62_21980 [Oligoflexia bacterium]|nr:hypothetical protein [Oligoflexia bacterium]
MSGQSYQSAEVSPEMIAAILADENHRRDTRDAVQDVEVGAGGTTTEKPVAEQTFGAAQMQPQVVSEFVNGGYLAPPASWTGDELDRSLEMLTDDAQAPALVAARLQQTVDHRRTGGVDIGRRRDILGTLYSLGLQGSSGVHADPQSNNRGTAIAAMIPRLECALGLP